MHISIKQLMLLVACAALACVSLKFATPAWWIVLSGIGLTAYLAMTVVALVGQSSVRTFAVGFTACVTIYVVLLYALGRPELDNRGKLPTTMILWPVYQSVMTVEVKGAQEEVAVGEEVEERLGLGARANGSIRVRTPERWIFMSIGHFWFALLIGWLGGFSACWVRVHTRNNGHGKPT